MVEQNVVGLSLACDSGATRLKYGDLESAMSVSYYSWPSRYIGSILACKVTSGIMW